MDPSKNIDWEHKEKKGDYKSLFTGESPNTFIEESGRSKYDLPFSKQCDLLQNLVNNRKETKFRRANKPKNNTFQDYLTISPNVSIIHSIDEELSPDYEMNFPLQPPRPRPSSAKPTLTPPKSPKFIYPSQIKSLHKEFSNLIGKTNILEKRTEKHGLVLDLSEFNQVQTEKKLKEIRLDNDDLKFTVKENEKEISRLNLLIEEVNTRLTFEISEKEQMKKWIKDLEKQQINAFDQIKRMRTLENQELQNKIFNSELAMRNNIDRLRTDMNLNANILQGQRKTLQKYKKNEADSEEILGEAWNLESLAVKILFFLLLLILVLLFT